MHNISRQPRPAFTAVDKYYEQFGDTWRQDINIGDDFKVRPWWVRELFLVQTLAAVKDDEIIDAYGFLDALEDVHLNAEIK